MYSLWAKRRPINGRGYPYEFIFSFDDESYKYTAMDTLDRSVYQEGMIVNKYDNSCVMYVEFEEPLVLKREGRRL